MQRATASDCRARLSIPRACMFHTAAFSHPARISVTELTQPCNMEGVDDGFQPPPPLRPPTHCICLVGHVPRFRHVLNFCRVHRVNRVPARRPPQAPPPPPPPRPLVPPRPLFLRHQPCLRRSPRLQTPPPPPQNPPHQLIS